MNKDFKIPPKKSSDLTSPKKLIETLKILIGTEFKLTGKTRTDGSNIRKLVASVLEQNTLPEKAESNEYEIIPPKSKGIPKITREFIDTYMVTSGKTYNLQVWNRMPASKMLLIKLEGDDSLKCSDVRFIFVRINVEKEIISSILILTPEYIEANFGKFGKPTIKHQLLISSKVRADIYASEEKILFFPDTKKLTYLLKHDFEPPKNNMIDEPSAQEIYSLEFLKEKIAKVLIGEKLESDATKNRGQALERRVLELLDYPNYKKEQLYGAFPDIRNQLLEVKVQDSPTVDLGKFSPEFEEIIIEDLNLTTHDVRYLIALTNSETEIIDGIILVPGAKLGEVFSYVSSQSYKCQRSIPIDFFDKFEGQSVFNPKYILD
jgi:hypothetical protein